MTDFARLERQITAVLRFGIWTATIALAAGLAAHLAGLASADRWLAAGLLVLIAIPIGRIAASFVEALRRRDWLLVGSTATVLLVMALTFVYAVGRR